MVSSSLMFQFAIRLPTISTAGSAYAIAEISVRERGLRLA